jgi:hypothetical protein
VGQFYGGQFIEKLTAAIQSGASTRNVFNAYSPEVYQSLSDVAQDAAQAALPGWKGGYLKQEGFLAFAGNSHKSSANDDGHQAFGVSFTSSNVGYVRSLGEQSVLVTVGNVTARTDGSTFRSSGDGRNGSISLLGGFTGLDNATWHVGLGLSSLTMGGARDSLGAGKGFGRVGAKSTVLETGLETKRAIGESSYFKGRSSVAFGSTSRDGLSESGANEGLDTMTVKAKTTSYRLFDLSAELGTNVAANTEWYGSFGVQLGSASKALTASFDNDQAQVTVNANSALDSSSKVMTGFRYRDKRSNIFEVAVGGTRSWDSKTNSLARVSFYMPF